MARDFTIQMDTSRLSGTVVINTTYIPTVNQNASSSYVGTYPVDPLNSFLPGILVQTNYESNIPFVHQVPSAISLKFTNQSYKVSIGEKE